MTPESAPMGWWVVSGENLMAMLQRAHAGEDPDAVYAEEYANGNHEVVPGEQASAGLVPPPANLTDFPAGASEEQWEGEWRAPCGCSWTRTENGGRLHDKCGEHWLD